MRCFECGAENPADSVFCQSCGRRLRPDVNISNKESVNQEPTIQESMTPESANAAEAEPANAETANAAAESENNTEENADVEVDGAEAEESANSESANAETANAANAEGEEFVDGSYRITYEDFKTCPRCGEKVPRDANFCTNCAYWIEEPAPKKKSAKVKALIIAAAVVFVAAVIAAVGAVYPQAYDLKGTWVSADSDMSLFGFMTESYMIIDDDSLDYYYNAFFSSEYEYSYNAYTKTLKLYSNGNKAQTLHLKWVDTDTFVIVENGESFVRAAEAEDTQDDGEKRYSI